MLVSDQRCGLDDCTTAYLVNVNDQLEGQLVADI